MTSKKRYLVVLVWCCWRSLPGSFCIVLGAEMTLADINQSVANFLAAAWPTWGPLLGVVVALGFVELMRRI